MRVLKNSILLIGMLLVAGLSQAQNQDLSVGVVILIVPTTPGTGSDIAARLLAPRLSQRLGRPVIVENRTGQITFSEVDFLKFGIIKCCLLKYILKKG